MGVFVWALDKERFCPVHCGKCHNRLFWYRVKASHGDCSGRFCSCFNCTPKKPFCVNYCFGKGANFT